MFQLNQHGVESVPDSEQGLWMVIVDSWEVIINAQRFPVVLDDSDENQHFIIILSNLSEMYETYVGGSAFSLSMQRIGNVLNESGRLVSSNKEGQVYLVAGRDLRMKEGELWEAILVYRWLSLIQLKETISFSALQKLQKSWSLWPLHNLKRWRNVSKAHFFFDSEHFIGKLKLWPPNRGQRKVTFTD